ncbi:DNA polymerase I [Candidatus Hydrogenisulfobacillus filiaventi]|uniref:DNA polymerase I n=1 Tax=Candidatus Hydrogenisulfobacillus filiaventi TaxID=2707344 RepID=A0A6F8ZGP6_9FIRM|nr:DNA polymerase I [Bacillota bacterium]CAB1128635.1 DNA polymerase I [Candidatus Hydrogenisulfobacillus filiaventi]
MGSRNEAGLAAAPAATTRPVLLAVDGHSLLFRAYHAMPPLTRSDGLPTGALLGFANMLLRVIREAQPQAVVVCWDSGRPTFRHAVYPAYKATRQEAPPEFRQQVELAHQLLDALGIPRLAEPGFEADDLLGSLARRAREAGWEVRIVTGDRDLLQLVQPGVEVWLTAAGLKAVERMDAAAVRRKLGVDPGQVPDLKGLMGDPSDNLPGVPGVGQKTAVALLQRFPDLEALFAGLDGVEPRVRRRLEGQEAVARQSRDLATIRQDVPVPWPPAAAPFQLRATPEALAFLESMEMRTVAERLKDREQPEAPAATALPDPVPEPPAAVPEWTAWPTEAAAVALLPDGDAGWWGFAPGRGSGRWPRPALPEAGGQRRAGWGVKAFWRQAWEGRRPEPALSDDVKIMAYLANPERSRYELDDLLADAGLTGAEGRDPGRRVAGLYRLWERLDAELAAAGMGRLYREVELPLIPILARMEAVGIRIDRDRLVAIGEALAADIARTQARIYELAGTEFNINSPQQLADVLFSKLGLPSGKRTKTGFSTDAETLEQLAPAHPVVAEILTFRQLVKLRGTYVDGLLPLIDAEGRVHTTFHQTGTATGRLSSSDPNLQNIPVRLPLGRQLRSVFLPSPGRVLLSADYSQIELRMLAHLSGDPGLIEAFRSGEDFHRRTAAEIFGLDPAAVDETWRSRAKAVNFGIVYGISDFGLARDTGVSREEARDYIERYFARYPRLKAYLEELKEQARTRGYSTTILGRRRPLRDIHSQNRMRRQYAERMAMNSVIQGSAADLIKVAMVRLAEAFRERGLKAELVLQVHDELIWDTPLEEVPAVAELAAVHMTSALPLAVPLQVDLKAGDNWEAMHPIGEPAPPGT